MLRIRHYKKLLLCIHISGIHCMYYGYTRMRLKKLFWCAWAFCENFRLIGALHQGQAVFSAKPWFFTEVNDLRYQFFLVIRVDDQKIIQILQPIYNHRFFFDAFVYSWYFIIFFLIMKTKFSYFPGMLENPTPAKYYLKKTKSKNIMKY